MPIFVGKMYLTFTIPGLPRKPVIAGVYKLSFDDTWFYFGSTKNILSRFHKWKTELSRGIYKNFRLAEVCVASSRVKMEIIEVISEPERLLERETHYLQQYWGNPLLLNRAPQGGTNTGMKLGEQQKVALRARLSKLGCPVGKYTKDGIFVEKYDSIATTVKANKLSKKALYIVLRYSGRSTGGFVYRKLDAEGNPILPPPRPQNLNKKRGPMSSETKKRMCTSQKKWRTTEDYMPVHAKPMVKCDAEGNILEKYRSFHFLASTLKADPRSLNQMLKKGRPGYYKGFFYHPE